jgi:hypothetical protein
MSTHVYTRVGVLTQSQTFEVTVIPGGTKFITSLPTFRQWLRFPNVVVGVANPDQLRWEYVFICPLHLTLSAIHNPVTIHS